MSSKWRRFEALLPLRFNDGRDVPAEWIADAILEIVDRFGAASYETQKVEGHWRHGAIVYRDDLVRVVVDVADTGGHLVGAVVHEASIQDRDGAPALLGDIRRRFPWLRHLFADSAYAGVKLATALAPLGKWTIEIVKRVAGTEGFTLPAASLGGRAHAGLAQSQSPPRQRLRSVHRRRHRLAPHRQRQAPLA